MKTDAILFKPDGTEQHLAFDLPQDPGFHALDRIIRPLIDGANLERVCVLYHGQVTDMFVDDEGLLKGLPINEKASAIYNPRSFVPAIFGPAVLFLRRVWF